MNITVLRAVRRLEMDVDLEHKTKIVNVERDDEQFVTIYGQETDEQLYYFVLDQELIDKIKTI